MRAIAICLALALPAAPLRAEVPRVLADLLPVQSLVAQVMGNLGTPGVLLGPAADPHHFQMRPSQARAVAEADLVVWIGPALTPWLDQVLDQAGTADLVLLDAGHEGGHDAHEDETEHDAEPGGHDHDAAEAHAWLDPLRAAGFLENIAERLADLDPANAGRYRTNAATAVADLQAMVAELTAELSQARGIALVPFHDAYRGFFDRFGLDPAISLAPGDAASPGAARLAAVRETLAAAPRACVFTEPGRGTALAEAVLPRPDIPVLELDPVGAGLTPGAGLYEALIRDLAAAVLDCVRRTGA